jgi:hypothetical protein
LAVLLALGTALGSTPAAADDASVAPLAPPPAHVPTDLPEVHGGGSIVVWPTLTPAGDEPDAVALHRPTASEPAVAARAQELDATLRDGVEDLGYTLDVADPGPVAGHVRDEDLLARAGRETATAPAAASHAEATKASPGPWVVSSRLEPAGSGSFMLRIVAASPGGHDLRVRVETVKGDDIPVRGLVMLRDLLASTSTTAPPGSDEAKCVGCASMENVNTTGLRSPGRAVLAVNGAIFGGYTAFSLQQASNSNDPRVLYPLLALGTGIGLGASLLVSEEWDISTGDAWFLSAGAWWGAGSGILISTGLGAPTSNQFAYGVASGLGGIALATFALTRSTMDEGDALLAHSGGALGLFLGGLTEFAYKGQTNATPYTGAGYGAAIGVVGAGALATVVRVSPARVMLVDTGAALGALAGAAIGSPLVFQNVTEAKNRLFLSAMLTGTVAGGVIGWALTRDTGKATKAFLPGSPNAGIIGQSVTPTGTVPAYGVGWSGSF